MHNHDHFNSLGKESQSSNTSLDDITTTLRAHFTVAQNSYFTVHDDTLHFSERKILYSFDFSLLHPYIFPSTHGKDHQYDAMGRSIFSILPAYANACGFVPVFSTPSLLELLDSLEHRYNRIHNLLRSDSSLSRIRSRLKASIDDVGELYGENQSELARFLSSLRLNDKQHDSLNLFLGLFANKKISMIRDHIDPIEIKRLHVQHKSLFDLIFRNMEKERGAKDSREYKDKEFHYRVDSWNLTMALLSKYFRDVEVDHVCRGGISKFVPNDFKREFTRHPLIPMIRLLSLLRASEDDHLQDEANAFVRLGARDLSEALKLVEAHPIGHLTSEERNEISRVYDKYIRPMYFDYSRPDGAVDIHKAIEEIREMERSKYKSITTVDGLREMFMADADDIKRSAHVIVETNPDIMNSRVLEDYSLEKSPRIDEIRKQFDL